MIYHCLGFEIEQEREGKAFQLMLLLIDRIVHAEKGVACELAGKELLEVFETDCTDQTAGQVCSMERQD